MDKPMYPPSRAKVSSKRKELAPQPVAALKAFGQAVFADGALNPTTKQSIAVAAAHATEWPYCIKGHTAAALKRGATDQEIVQAIWVAAETRAGAAYGHSTLSLETMAVQTNVDEAPDGHDH